MNKLGGNTAEDLRSDRIVEEPSMEEILASIKQIIADDEAPNDGLSERDRYTYPDNPSNSNQLDDASMEAAMEAELQRAGLLVSSRAAQSATTAREQAPFAGSASSKPRGHETLGQRAARLRAELSNPNPNEVADDRSGQHQMRSHLESLAAERAARAQLPPLAAAPHENHAPRPAPQPIPQAPPAFAHNPIPQAQPSYAPQPVQPTTQEIANQVAESIMRERADEIHALVGDILRPTIRKWLSDNLPNIVERLVRDEIQAVSRGGRV